MAPEHGKTAPAGTVLIVDDNPEARRMLEIRIRREGYHILQAENGHQALDLWRRHAVDVILLDIYMPEVNGFEVLAAIKADPLRGHVPILMISGGGDQDDLVRCIELGAVDYLSKPFNQAVLRARLSTCVAAKRQRDLELQGRPGPIQAASPPPTMLAPELPTSAFDTGQFSVPGRLGRIVLEQLLGQGSQGQVYLGRHELLGLPVAVKLLDVADPRDPDRRARVLREARVAARLSHRNIVRLHEVGEADGLLYLAYEYVAGGSLADLLRDQPDNRLDLGRAVRIARDVAAGLAEIQRLGLTHRDIKPGNLLLTPEGETKIGDLGLAKPNAWLAGADGDLAADALTREQSIVGTPAYMAPEQIEGRPNLDIRCDLYALGGVVYAMLTGQTLFADKVFTMAVLLAHLHSPPLPPSALRPDVPAWLDAVCLKLLAKNPADRYATPEALLADLARPTP